LAFLVGNIDTFLKNSEHFMQLIKDIIVQNRNIWVNFDVVSLFTNVPVEKALQIIKDELCMDITVLDHFLLQVDDVEFMKV
jgi:hypothetical protein